MPELPSEVAKALEGVELTEEHAAALAVILDAAKTEVPEGYVPATELETPGVTTPDSTDDKPSEETPVEKSAEVIAVEKRLEESEATIAKMVEETEIAKAEATARERYPDLAKATEIGGAMYRMRVGAATEEDLTLVDEVLAGASEQVKTSKIAGTIGKSDEGSNSTTAELERLAKSAQDANPELTPEQAFREAMNTPKGQELWAQSLTEDE